MVRLFRVLANTLRLRMLRAVYRQPGCCVEQLAEAVNVSESIASRHLRLLASYQLVSAAPSGKFVRYACPPDGVGGNEFLRKVRGPVRALLTERDPRRTLSKVCDNPPPEAPTWGDVFQAMVHQFTAYTHLRRLLILRLLLREGRGAYPRIVAEIGMSPDAARRQLAKLKRRGVIRSRGEKGVWEAETQRGPWLRSALMETVGRVLMAQHRPSTAPADGESA